VARRYFRRGGGELWVEIHHVLVRNRAGVISGMRTAMLDITKRKQAEDAREAALNRLLKIASQVPGLVYQYRLRPGGSGWVIQDKIALTPDEENAIDLKRELVAIHERVHWNPALALPPKEFDLTDAEVTRIKGAIETADGYAANADRRWLQPLLNVIFADAKRR
jgi:hypothetical protein